MIDTDKLLRQIQDGNKDAINIAKGLGVGDKKEFLSYASQKLGGMGKVFTLMTGLEKPVIRPITMPIKRRSNNNIIERDWANDSINIGGDCLYPENPKIGVAIGTFAAFPYIHMQLEARKRFYPNIPFLIHDDCSPKRDALSKLCKEYGAHFESNAKRKPHHLGDLSAFYGGLKWANYHNFDILLKLSRRWIFRVDWVSDLIRLAQKSQYATFSNYTSTFGFGFRTECTGMSVKKWTDVRLLEDVSSKINQSGHVFVEQYVHHRAIELEKFNCRIAEDWRLAHPADNDKRGYASWDMMGTDRAAKSDAYLWHNCNSPNEYLEQADNWGLKYTIADFSDPNQGFGDGPKNVS